MAKQTKKTPRGEMYRTIIEGRGINFDECDVLAFVFSRREKPHLFHFSLMLQKPVYYLIDCFETCANVIVPKDAKNAAAIIALAEQDGGQKTMPDLR